MLKFIFNEVKNEDLPNGHYILKQGRDVVYFEVINDWIDLEEPIQDKFFIDYAYEVYNVLVYVILFYLICCSCIIGSFYKTYLDVKSLDKIVQQEPAEEMPNLTMAQMAPSQSIARG